MSHNFSVCGAIVINIVSQQIQASSDEGFSMWWYESLHLTRTFIVGYRLNFAFSECIARAGDMPTRHVLFSIWVRI
jgi:hypothetical protein